MIKKYLHTIMSLALLSSIIACTDEIPYDDRVIGPGEAIVSASIDFHPLVATVNNTGSRASHPGDLISTIDDLTVFLYDVEGNLQEIYNGDELEGLEIKKKNETGSNTGMPNDAGIQAEESTARATFTINGVPFGQYRMYAVANVEAGGFEDNATNRERFAKEKSLRDYKVEWNEKNIGENDQMFGYFTPDGNDEASDGFQGPILRINKPHTSLHAWIKRAASKVTIVYDGSGLHQGVYVYIKSVKIMDIPRYCKIGNENWVKTTDADSMIVDGGIMYYSEQAKGETDQAPTDNYKDWMRIAKGTALRGAVTTDPNDKDNITGEHSEYAGALYFYENCQGNYKDAANKQDYNKVPDWDKVGFIPEPGQYDYKDNVPYGTYIEVEGYYVSDNPEQVSEGKILYRFMLGQDTQYDYNAFRNHHYKLTLGFKGWANQPDWHIVYKEPENTFFTDPTYYVSYSYNNKATFPVRFVGDIETFDVEIVENNWAPYDEKGTNSAPDGEVGSGNLAFKWNRAVYDNKGGGMYYGLQKPWNSDGSAQADYPKEEIEKGAPTKVTPIWAGFLALMVPDKLTATIIPGTGTTYSTDYPKLKNYFYGKGDGNTVPQNKRSFTTADMNFKAGEWEAGKTARKTIGTGNNVCEVIKAPDGSTTLNLVTWTRPKSMLGISGFTGNNPYDTYQRKAVVKLTAKFKGVEKEIVKYMPIFQVRRVVNPKGVCRQWDDNDAFRVKLMRRVGADADKFSTFASEGAWRAYVQTVSTGAEGFISLTPGTGAMQDTDGAIYGNTDTDIDFTINFNGKGQSGKSLCAIVKIEYHGFTCNHSIFVRQGYYEPITVMDNAKWSSFSLYSCDSKTAYQQQWIPDDKNNKYIDAVVTASPLSLGTLFKRGNYAEGIWIENNAEKNLGPLESPGSTLFKLTNGESKAWADIEGTSFQVWGTDAEGKPKKDISKAGTIEHDFKWGRFKATVNNGTRYYRVPTYAEFNSLLSGEYGIGVLYADGAKEPAEKVDDAYGFEDFDNDGQDKNHPSVTAHKGGKSGMRGFIVFNPTNAHQIFFPLGARGIGRRTIQNVPANGDGVLRYGAVNATLTQAQNVINQYRPIPFNLPASPGAIYWINQHNDNKNNFLAWDMNYFDLNFLGYDYACSFVGGGDALPIKLVRDDSAPSK